MQTKLSLLIFLLFSESYALREYITGDRLPIHLDNILCNGNESQLNECDGLYNVIRSPKCLFSEAAVICTGKNFKCNNYLVEKY